MKWLVCNRLPSPAARVLLRASAAQLSKRLAQRLLERFAARDHIAARVVRVLLAEHGRVERAADEQRLRVRVVEEGEAVRGSHGNQLPVGVQRQRRDSRGRVELNERLELVAWLEFDGGGG